MQRLIILVTHTEGLFLCIQDPNASTTPTEAPTTTTFPTGSPGSHCTEPGINGDNTDCTVYYNCALVSKKSSSITPIKRDYK